MTIIICDVCGRDGSKLVRRPFNSLCNQMPIRLDSVEMYECERCGESTLTSEQAKEVSKQVKPLAREHLNLLPPEKTIDIRKRCHLSQKELESLFGLGEKVVIRWEKGRVLQSKTADVFLRLMDQNPDIFEDMRKIHA